jgi:hypothetical protein
VPDAIGQFRQIRDTLIDFSYRNRDIKQQPVVPGFKRRVRVIANHDKTLRSLGRPFPLQGWGNILPFAGIRFGNHTFMLKSGTCYFHFTPPNAPGGPLFEKSGAKTFAN